MIFPAFRLEMSSMRRRLHESRDTNVLLIRMKPVGNLHHDTHDQGTRPTNQYADERDFVLFKSD